MSKLTWAELDARRTALPKRLSRAELARRCGLSESTITKGVRFSRSPQKKVRDQVLLVLDAVEKMAEAGL